METSKSSRYIALYQVNCHSREKYCKSKNISNPLQANPPGQFTPTHSLHLVQFQHDQQKT